MAALRCAAGRALLRTSSPPSPAAWSRRLPQRPLRRRCMSSWTSTEEMRRKELAVALMKELPNSSRADINREDEMKTLDELLRLTDSDGDHEQTMEVGELRNLVGKKKKALLAELFKEKLDGPKMPKEMEKEREKQKELVAAARQLQDALIRQDLRPKLIRDLKMLQEEVNWGESYTSYKFKWHSVWLLGITASVVYGYWK